MELRLRVRQVPRRVARTTGRSVTNADVHVRIADADEYELESAAGIEPAGRDLHGEQGAVQRRRVDLGAVSERAPRAGYRLHPRLRRHAPESAELPGTRERRNRREAGNRHGLRG